MLKQKNVILNSIVRVNEMYNFTVFAYIRNFNLTI